jgi:acetylglutamate kinase
MREMIEKAAVLIEALPYIQSFRGDTIVVKFGGSIMENPAGVEAILKDVAFMACVGLRPVIVHGGGKAISRRLKEEGVESTFVRGLRVTDANAVRLVEHVLNQEVNPELVGILERCGCRARGIHGDSVLRVEKTAERDERTGDVLDWGYVGHVTDVDAEPLRAFQQSDIVPVITPLGRGADAALYNVNADEAANAVAMALQARKLVFLSDVPGLLRDPEDASTLISTVRADEVDGLIEQGVIAGGMRPKIGGALKALCAGVKKAHIIDSAMPHSLLLELFTDRGVGTEIVSE